MMNNSNFKKYEKLFDLIEQLFFLFIMSPSVIALPEREY